MKNGTELINEERQKQIDKYGFTAEHHYNHDEWYEDIQLQYAAHSMLANELYEQAEVYDNLPSGWDEDWWERMCNKSRKERLIIAGALIAAELDRINIIESKASEARTASGFVSE